MKLVILLIVVLHFFQSYSQNNEYKLIINEQGIQIFAKEIECLDIQNGIHQAFYALQFVNNTTDTVSITWNIDYWINGACVTCNKPKTPENTYTLQLLPDQIIEGNCDKKSHRGTKVYIREMKNNKSSVLSKFEIVNLQVNFL